MRRLRLLVIALALVGCEAPGAATKVQPGDIIFHTSRSTQSRAIQMATHSPYSHMGLVLVRSGRTFVLEAAGKVQFTPFDEWVARGVGGKYEVKRLKDASVLASPARMHALEDAAEAFLGRPYDPYFEWSDDRIYCSELVWKAYDRSLGIQLGRLASLSTFDLSSDAVKQKLSERYGRDIPMNEPVISPGAMFESPLLVGR